MKFKTINMANTFGIVTATLYLVCAFFVAFMPGLTKTVAQSWFHGIDITKIANVEITLLNTFYGLVSIIALSLIVGWLFAIKYNYLSARLKK